MIVKFKIFENVSQKLKVGDFVLCKYSYNGNPNKKINIFISENIGIVRKIDEMIKVEYFPVENEDEYTLNEFRYEQGFDNKRSTYNFTPKNHLIFDMDECEYWADNKHELEVIVQSNKYNL